MAQLVKIRSDQSLSRVRLFVTPWAVACQALLSIWILQARILEWVAIYFSIQETLVQFLGQEDLLETR